MDITVEMYSEKCVIVRGNDTRPIKEQLKELGGKWNSRLTDKDSGEKFGAWVFTKDKKNELETYIESVKKEPSKHLTINKDTSSAGLFSGVTTSFPHKPNTDFVKLNARLDKFEKMLTMIMTALDIEQEDEESEEEEAPTKRLLRK